MANDAIVEPHTQAIAGDTLTTISLNYKWRKLIVDMLAPLCFDDFWTGTTGDIETSVNNALDLIRDIYDVEAPAGGSSAVIGFNLRLNADQNLGVGSFDDGYFTDPGVSPYFDPQTWLLSDPGTVLTCPVGYAGKYLLIAHGSFFSTGSQVAHSIRIMSDGVNAIGLTYHALDNATSFQCIAVAEIVEGEELTIQFYGNGASQKVYATSGTPTRISGIRLGD